MSKLEMPHLSWFTVEERIERLKEIDMLDWISHKIYSPTLGMSRRQFSPALGKTDLQWEFRSP
jgi:phage tail protein X